MDLGQLAELPVLRILGRSLGDVLDSRRSDWSSFLINGGTYNFCFSFGTTFFYYFQDTSKRGLIKD